MTMQPMAICLSTLRKFKILVIVSLAFSAPVRSQVGIEPVAKSLYPAQWPAGPTPDSVPDWAKPGRIRFARWDGGPLETAKGILSGWSKFNPPDPNYVETMA